MMNYDARNRLRHFYEKNQLIGLGVIYESAQTSGECILCEPGHLNIGVKSAV